MKVQFYLKRPNAPSTSLYASVHYGKNRLKYYIKESIETRFWNSSTKRARETAKFIEYPELNARLDHIAATIKNVYRRYVNDHKLAPDMETFKKLLDIELKYEDAPQSGTEFFGFFSDLIEKSKEGTRLNPGTGKPISPNTVKTYISCFRHLREFKKSRNRNIEFNTIDFDFYDAFVAYLTKEKNLSTNAIGKYIQILKVVLNEATDAGLNTNMAYKSRKFLIPREKSDSIYLKEEELKEMASLDLSDAATLDKARDLFLVGCYTGLRFSDYSTIQTDKVENGLIEVEQQKTGETITIPIHPVVEGIFEKYAYELPRLFSNQKLNQHLKVIGQKCTLLNAEIAKRMTKSGRQTSQQLKKYELLTSHTARRSFATNEYLSGTPTITIMAITGHKTEKAFMKYIKATSLEYATNLK